MFLCTVTMASLEQWVSDQLHDILGLSDRYVAQFMIGLVQKSSGPQDFVARLQETGTIDIDQRITAFAHELYNKVCFYNQTVCLMEFNTQYIYCTYLCNDLSFQAPKKHVVEKPARAIERQVIEMERRNRTYTLLEDSESDGETVKERGKEKKTKDRDKGKKRKHLRQKREESPSSSEEDKKKR